MPHRKALDKLKISLMMDSKTIFYTTILFSLVVEWTDTIPTAGTDGIKLLLNPQFFSDLTENKQKGLIIHEILHVALSHMTRRGTRNPVIFNIAGDIVINNTLLKANYELPDGACFDKDLNHLNTEQVYDHLLQQAEKDLEQYQSDLSNDVNYTTSENHQQVENEVITTLLRAKTQVEVSNQTFGAVPGEMLINLEERINPKLPWNVILQHHMHSAAKNDYSWSRPNKRYMPDFYLPILHSDSLDHVCIAIDCSGSVTDEEFSYFIREIKAIQEDLQPNLITVIAFDTEIQQIHTITSETDIFKELKFTGRGGTDVTELIDWAIKHSPDILLVFTDGWFNYPDVYPNCNLIWLIHNNTAFTATKGKIINYNLEV